VFFLAACGIVHGEPILESANVNYLDLQYMWVTLQSPGGPIDIGLLSIRGEADVIVEYDTGQVTLDNGEFSLTTFLGSDQSSLGLANALFGGGSISVLDADDNDLLAANIVWLRLTEVVDGSGLLAGNGRFELTGGSLPWPEDYGCLINLSFHLEPNDIEDFDSDFAGIAKYVTLEPAENPGGDIPEPGTMTLLALGVAAGAGWVRRRRG